jgi:16S rRNA (uracil1498-N3)-methyltransferase
MSRRRFFVDEVRNGQASISGDEAKHLTRVLRVERGELYEISDNHHVYLAEVTLAHKGEVLFEVRESAALKPEGLRVTLYAAMFKFDHFEWMIEKVTELGVDRIIPVIAVRSERGLDQAAFKRIERWRRILVEASQQSRRDRLPEIELPVKLARVLADERCEIRVLLDEESEQSMPLASVPVAGVQQAALALGPEGGWTAEERQSFTDAGWKRTTLGPQILRAETAAIAGMAVLQASAAAASYHLSTTSQGSNVGTF